MNEHPYGMDGLATEYTFGEGVFSARTQKKEEEFSAWRPLKWNNRSKCYVWASEKEGA